MVAPIRKLRVNAHHQALLIRLLYERGGTFYDLADATGLHYNTVRSYVNELYRHDLAYISAWTTDGAGHRNRPIYSFGYKAADAPKPRRLTPTERSRNYRMRKRAINNLRTTVGLPAVRRTGKAQRPEEALA